MKKDEIVYKLHKEFISNDCVQVSLGFEDNLMVYNTSDLMYYKKIEEIESNNQEYKNDYLIDSRSLRFPYSKIPEHIEQVSLFKKNIFANQILEYNKPYIAVSDRIINKITIFKENESAYIYFQSLTNLKTYTRKIILNREELETYYKTGTLKIFDENQYIKKYIFYINGCIPKNHIKTELELLKYIKEEVIDEISSLEELSDLTYTNILKAVNDMDDFAPLIIAFDNYMIKFNQNNEIVIDYFIVKYLKKDKYELAISNIPVNVETLEMIKSRIDLSKVRYLKEPHISKKLNPDISLIDLDIEEMKLNDLVELNERRKKSILKSIQRQEDAEVNEQNKQRKKSLGRTKNS